jgi:Leucine-rich repeat (LRR) protein
VLALSGLLLFSACSGSGDKTAADRGTGKSQQNQVIDFEDPVLERLLQEKLKKEEIRASDLADYRRIHIAADEFVFLTKPGEDSESVAHYMLDDEFEFEGKRYHGFGTMTTLADLKHFAALEEINVTLQPKIDYSTIPASVAKKVTIMRINQSKLTSIDFVSDFPQLGELDIDGNDVSDLGPLAGKSSLISLRFRWNQVEDLSPLSDQKKLRTIQANSNKVSDLSPLAELPKLEEIGFYDNKIVDVSPLQGMSTLTNIELSNNRISDVSPLKDFTSIEELRLVGNPIKNIELLSRVPNVEY